MVPSVPAPSDRWVAVLMDDLASMGALYGASLTVLLVAGGRADGHPHGALIDALTA